MSDKTLFNKDLVLNSLVINNAIDSNASGYVPQQTVINDTSITTTNLSGSALFLNTPNFPATSLTNINGVMSSNQAIASNDYLFGQNVNVGNNLTIKNNTLPTNDVVLSCPNNSVLNVGGELIATNIGLVSSTGNVNLTAPSAGALNVGGTIQCTTLGTPDVVLQNGTNQSVLSASPSLNNTILASGNLFVGNGTVGTITAGLNVSSPLFSGGIICANWVPASNIVCAPGLYTSTTCVIQNVPTNINYANCVYSFQAQALNAQTACLPVSFPSYTATLNGNNLTLQIYISLASGGSNNIAINYIGIMIINPAYGAIAP